MDDLVTEDRFRSLIDDRMGELMAAAVIVCSGDRGPACFTRPFLSDLLGAASELEEVLDAYGAGRNRRWYPLRRLVATVKLFSGVGYQLQHILLFLPDYRLLPVEHDFPAATRQAVDVVCAILRRSLDAVVLTGRDLGIAVREGAPQAEILAEGLPSGRLLPDRTSQKVAPPEQTVARVATAFLNLAEDGKFIHITQQEKPDHYADWIPEPISEAHLRDLEQGFHNLQSLYDTHIADTNVESLDAALPVLRGHVSVMFHLLQTATALAHYCERHILSFAPRRAETESGAQGTGAAQHDGEGVLQADAPIVDHREVLEVLMSYSLAFASRYMLATRGLCHEMLRRYAIQGHITVPVPRYRGFHVRPSTLVARIVAHYGSDVSMKLEKETYNAGFTLDLFRANEKITAVKRRLLAREVYRCSPTVAWGSDPATAVREVAHELFTEGKLVLYERNLVLDGVVPREEETQQEFLTRALTQLLAVGKIDMEMDVTVSFHGDRRVLEDIKLLAENGYGEDDFGNNLPLPERLSYLRK